MYVTAGVELALRWCSVDAAAAVEGSEGLMDAEFLERFQGESLEFQNLVIEFTQQMEQNGAAIKAMEKERDEWRERFYQCLPLWRRNWYELFQRVAYWPIPKF